MFEGSHWMQAGSRVCCWNNGSNLRARSCRNIVLPLGMELPMTSYSAEARLWQVLGMAFLVGGGLPLGLTILQIAGRRLVEADALQLGVAYAIMILIGFVALVAARV